MADQKSSNIPILSPWDPPDVTQPLRLDVLHQGEPKMVGLILHMHPALHGQREWAFYHAHSGTQTTRHYRESWGIGIDAIVFDWLLAENIFHIYVHNRRQKLLRYTNADRLLQLSFPAEAGGRLRHWLKPEHWWTVALSRIPSRIPYVPQTRWITLDPADWGHEIGEDLVQPHEEPLIGEEA